MKAKIPLLFTTLALVCLAAVGPKAQAVSPPPDGGYPGFNTAEGDNALKNLNTATGVGNTAVGWFSLFSDVEGGFNTGVGAGALVLNTGSSNTATGAAALFLNTTGERNTANGAFALFSNTEGIENTATGANALNSNTTGKFNTAHGFEALFNNDTGFGNTAVGYQALFNNISNDNNTATGKFALFNNTIGSGNTANGVSALAQNISGINNTALGLLAGNNVTTADNVICIGAGVPGANVDNTCFIGNIFGVTTQNADAIPVLVDSDGQLGTASSSRQFKKEIKPMDKVSEAILALKPVTFRYRNHKSSTPQFGLIAEDVAEVNPDLVVRDKDGDVYTVRYDAVNAMLLNEFLKAHDKIEEQQKQIHALTAQLKQQAALIRKVSDEVDLNRSTRRAVGNEE
jgi:Chaperone of endosialidase